MESRIVGKCALIALALIAIATGTALAAQYYVSTSGNNSAAGTASAPWRTLQYAADRVGPGDRVTVRPGDYTGFHLDTSGTAVAPIEFFAEPGVLVNQPNPVRTDHGINLENASYVTIDGFAVTGMNRAGVRSVGVNGSTFASHVTIRNVHSYNNQYWGILTGFVNDLVIENNETSGSRVEHGIYVSNSGDRPIIRNNLTWGNDKNGIHVNGDAELGGDGIISNALISGNVIYDNGSGRQSGVGGGSGINMDGVQNSRIENNLIYNQHASGISLYRIDGGGGSTGNVVVNNTIHVASDGRWALNIRDGSTNNTALNNILINDHSFRGAISVWPDSRSGFVSDYNAVISRFTINDGSSVLSLDQWRALAGNESNDDHSFVATAAQLFQNAATGDYRLRENSPARNTGTSNLAPAFDLEGKPRPIGALVDIGAFEFGVAALAGDFNADGRVDAADYSVWRDGLGSAYTAADLAIWRMHFGESLGSGSGSLGSASAVPEPAACWLLLVGIGLSMLRRS
jgi:hypothetical protein